jgi:hypothetical protein
VRAALVLAACALAACRHEPAPEPEPVECEPLNGAWIEADGRINGDILSLAVLDDRTVLAGTTFGIVALDPLTREWSDRIDFDAPVTSLAVDPADPARLLAMSLGIHESTDAGASWHPVLADPAVGVVAFAPSDPTRAYALLGTRALRSDDGGRTWTEVAADLPEGPHGLVVMTGDADAVYATWLTTEAGSGARSDDGGVTWDSSLGFFHVAVGAGETLYAGNVMGTTRSDDGGQTWTWLGGAEAYAIAADPGPPEIVYAASRGLVRASVDRGETWTTWIDFPAIGFPDTMVVGPDGGLYVGPTRGSAVLLLGDGGDEAHWYGGGISGEGRRLAPSQDGLLYVATTDGIFMSGHAGITWGTIAPELAIAPMTTPTLLVAPSDSAAMYFDFASDLGGNTTLVRTEDGGMTWLGVPAFDGTPAAVDPVSPHIIYWIADGGLASWDVTSGGAAAIDVGPGRVTGVFPDRDGGDALLVAAGERVVRMSNFGATADDLFVPERDLAEPADLGTIEGIFDTGSGEVLVSYNSGRFVHRDTLGAWTVFAPVIDVDLDAAPMTALTADPTSSRGLFGISGGRVYRSPDLGGTWCEVETTMGPVTGIATLGGLSHTLVASTESRLYRIAIE